MRCGAVHQAADRRRAEEGGHPGDPVAGLEARASCAACAASQYECCGRCDAGKPGRPAVLRYSLLAHAEYVCFALDTPLEHQG